MNSILKNKTKNIIAIVFSCAYAVMIVLNFNSMFFKNFRYAANTLLTDGLSLLLPVSVIVFIALKNKDFSFKKWLLPIVFGIILVKNTIIVCANFMNNFTVFEGELPSILWLTLIFSSLMLIAFALMFIGTLFDFKYVALLKYGTLSYLLLFVAALVLAFINAGGFRYFETISSAGYAQQLLPNFIKNAIRSLSLLLFYIGIFVLTTNKPQTKET